MARELRWASVIEAKNLVKRLIGRPQYRNAYQHHRLRLLRLLARGERIHAVTCGDFFDHEGPGSRALGTMFTIAFCRAAGFPYYHSKFSDLRHADRPQAEWDAAWEDFFRLGLDETPVEQSPQPVFDLLQLATPWMGGGGDRTRLLRPRLTYPRPAFYLEAYYLDEGPERTRLLRQFAQLLEDMAPEFTRRLHTGTPRRSNPVPILAVHIRRGDVQEHTPFMWTELDAFARAIGQVRKALHDLGIDHEVHVHSQGDRAGLAPLEGEGVRVFVDEDPLWTLRELVEADVLLMSKSCYSYCAAMLGESVAIFEDTRLPPFSDWIMREADGTIPDDELRRRLAAKFSAPRP